VAERFGVASAPLVGRRGEPGTFLVPVLPAGLCLQFPGNVKDRMVKGKDFFYVQNSQFGAQGIPRRECWPYRIYLHPLLTPQLNY
jgi:hypothetical protein